jgi:hypothetical protein
VQRTGDNTGIGDPLNLYGTQRAPPLHTLNACIPLPDITSAIHKAVSSAVCANYLELGL